MSRDTQVSAGKEHDESLTPAPSVSRRHGEAPRQAESSFLTDIARALCQSEERMPHALPLSYRANRPSATILIELVEALRTVLFPGYFGPSDLSDESQGFHTGATLDRVLQRLPAQIVRGFAMTRGAQPGQEEEARAITRRFLAKLPAVQSVLATDVQAAYDGDPAATCPEEAIYCYPGLVAITYYRLAHELHTQGVPLIPRIITEHAHSRTGIDIHPGATIGESFFIDHGTGVVIGETSVIGRHVSLYQGVTLGAKSFPKDEHGNPIKGIPRHPIIEDDVVIYAGATVLGRVTVGRNSVIGGGVWLTHSVSPGTVLSQAKERQDDAKK